MKLPKVTFAAAGDMLIQRVISTEYEGFREIRDYISKADASFFNFESIIYRDGIFGSQFNGGSYHNSDPGLWILPGNTALICCPLPTTTPSTGATVG